MGRLFGLATPGKGRVGLNKTMEREGGHSHKGQLVLNEIRKHGKSQQKIKNDPQ